MIQIKVSDEKIDLNQMHWSDLHLPQCGAANSFVGIVRNLNHGRQVSAVSYDAYIPLAEKVLTEIAIEAQEKWTKDSSVLIQHRTGKLSVGEISVAIIVYTPHRDESYQMSRYIIEELKVRAPIWKKEFYMDGETEWLKGHQLCSHHSITV